MEDGGPEGPDRRRSFGSRIPGMPRAGRPAGGAGWHGRDDPRLTRHSARLRPWYSSSISRFRRASIFMRSLNDRFLAFSSNR